jgi:hypothetical protein
MKADHKKDLILISILVGLVVGSVTNYMSLVPTSRAKADTTTDYWRGNVDEKLRQGESRDTAVSAKLESIEKEIRGICDDITEVKVQAARNGALYGMASSIVSYLVGLIIQTLASKRNVGRRKEGE